MKLAPYVESAVVSDCFEFARRARILDIRASPYDASQYMGLGDDLDLSPIAVEHTAGRQQYQMEQEVLWRDGNPLRARLIEAYKCFLNWPPPECTPKGQCL